MVLHQGIAVKLYSGFSEDAVRLSACKIFSNSTSIPSRVACYFRGLKSLFYVEPYDLVLFRFGDRPSAASYIIPDHEVISLRSSFYPINVIKSKPKSQEQKT